MIFEPALTLHIAASLGAVVAGLVPILARKGSPLHRLSGRAFAILMGTLLACAWVMTIIHFRPYFAALSASATLILFSGLRVLGRKRPDLRAEDRATMLDWAVTLATMAVGGWILLIAMSGQLGGRAPVAAALAYGALTTGGWDIWRFLRPLDPPFSPRLWTYEHLVKMLGAYGAVLSAFSGNFLTFLPAPWSQLWPSLLLQPVAILWVTILVLRRRAA